MSDDRREAIAAALQSTISDEPEVATVETPEVVAEPAPEPKDERTAEQRARDEKGRFAGGKQPTKDAKELVATTPTAPRAPNTWRKEAQAKWAGLDPEIQREVMKREYDAANGVAKYKPDATVGAEFKRLVAPFEQDFKRLNTNPMQAFADVMPALKTMYFGDNTQKAQALAALSVEFGIDPRVLSAYTPAQVDPHIAALSNDVQGMRQYFQQQQQQEQQRRDDQAQQERQGLTTEIQTFFQAHPSAQKLSQEMATLLDSGAAESLEDAYQKASWMSGEFAATTAVAPRENPVATARRRASSVTGAPTGRQALSDPTDRRAAIADAIAQTQRR